MEPQAHHDNGKIAYILYAHGARDPEWAAPIHAIKQHLQSLCADALVQAAFLEHMAPTLSDAVDQVAAQGAQRVVVVPLFFGRGGHLKKDLPETLAQVRHAHPTLTIAVTLAMGEDPRMVAAIASWIATAPNILFTS